MSRRFLALLMLLAAFVTTATADNVYMVDGTSFQNVDVHTFSPSEGFMAKIPQDDGRMSDELYDIPLFRLARVEFRKIDDQGAIPGGRPAMMRTTDGQEFNGTVIESARSTQSGLVFRVRQANTPLDAQAWDVPSDQIVSLDFTVPPPIPTPAPPPGMENFLAPTTDPNATAPTTGGNDYSGGDEYDDDFGSDDDWGSSSSDKEMSLEDLEDMDLNDVVAQAGGWGIIIGVILGWIAIDALISGTVLWMIGRHFKLSDTGFGRCFITGVAIFICTNLATALLDKIGLAGGCFGCVNVILIYLFIGRALIQGILKQSGNVAWQMALGVFLVRLVIGCLVGIFVFAVLVGATMAFMS